MPAHHRPSATAATVIPVLVALACAAAPAPAKAPAWTPVRAAQLDVTLGALATASPRATAMATADPGMRAVQQDGRARPADVRLRFTRSGDSRTLTPLGSGLIRRQIGLKLRAADPCNLVYAMWRTGDEPGISVQVKRNPGQTTSAACGNRGYTTVANLPLPASSALTRTHVLEARTRVLTGGRLLLQLTADGTVLKPLRVAADLVAGLAGPAGVRSDNGAYRFQLSVAGRT